MRRTPKFLASALGCLAAALVLAATAAATGDPPEFIQAKRLEWRDAQYRATLNFLSLEDGNRETSLGLEVSGPDPFRTLGLEEPKLAPRWRLGVNSFDTNLAGLTATGGSTSLSVYTLGVGWDYYFKRQPSTPFLAAYGMMYIPDRDGPPPAGRVDKSITGVTLGGGWEFNKFQLRLELGFLQGANDSANFGLGYTF